MSEMLLDTASDDLQEPDTIRGLLRDIREVRLAKMRKGIEVLGGEGEGVRLDGVGAIEISESRGLVVGIMDGLRKINASRELARREREEEERQNGGRGRDYEDEDEDML
jgi:GINS complex subunit 2